MSATWDGMNAGEDRLIPPDEPENYVVDVEQGDGVTRTTYKDGTTTWDTGGMDPNDAMEAAYGLALLEGDKSSKATLIDMVSYNKGHIAGWNEGYEYGLKAAGDNGYGKGVVDAAVTLRQGRPHSEGGDDANRDS